MQTLLEEYQESALPAEDSDISEDDADLDADVENSDEESASNESDSNVNSGWADSMAKILKTNRPKGKKTLVLSKAKKLSDVKKAKPAQSPGFEIIGEVKEESDIKEEVEVKVKEEDEPKAKKKREDFPDLRLKPNILEKEKDRALARIATRGVVQLFNAVRNQQKDLERKVEAAGPLERKKEKAMKSLNKVHFLDNLMGKSKSETLSKALKKETKQEPKDEKESSNWNVFRDDFMMGAKMKDWDKNANNDSEGDVQISDMSDSE